MRAKLLLHFFLISAVIACAASAQRVTILYTSEQNGYLEPCGCSRPQLGGLPRRHMLIKSFLHFNVGAGLPTTPPITTARSPKGQRETYRSEAASGSGDPRRTEADAELVLVLDNGDISKGFGRQEEIKSDISLSALDEMGYCALNVGEKDIFLGVDYLMGAQQNVSFPFISANLFHKREGRLFKPYVVRSFGEERQAGINIAIIGIISKEFEREISGVGGELCIEDPVKTLKRVLAEVELGSGQSLNKLRRPGEFVATGSLPVAKQSGNKSRRPVKKKRGTRSGYYPPTDARSGSGESLNKLRRPKEEKSGTGPRAGPVKSEVNAIILLAHSSVEEAKRLARLFPQISLIICGHGRDDPLFEPISVGHGLLTKPLNMTVSSQNERKKGDLSVGAASGSGNPRRTGTGIGNVLIVNSGSRGKYVGKVILTFDGKRHIIRQEHEVIELSEEIADSKAVVELLDYYQEILKSEDLLTKAQKETDRNGSFVGSQSCEDCHLVEFLVWKESKHARAYETLTEVNHVYDPECVACHTTGFRYESGFRSFDKTPQLVGVGCEDCHGPGSLHVEDTEKEYGAVFKQGSRTSEKQVQGKRKGESVCVECHNADRSPGFELDRYWQKVKH